MCEELLAMQPPQAAGGGGAGAGGAGAGGAAAGGGLAWRYRVLRVLQLRHHVPHEEAVPPLGGGARLVFACGTLRLLNRFVRHGLRLP